MLQAALQTGSGDIEELEGKTILNLKNNGKYRTGMKVGRHLK